MWTIYAASSGQFAKLLENPSYRPSRNFRSFSEENTQNEIIETILIFAVVTTTIVTFSEINHLENANPKSHFLEEIKQNVWVALVI